MNFNKEKIAEAIIDLRNTGETRKGILSIILMNITEPPIHGSYLPITEPLDSIQNQSQLIGVVQQYFKNNEVPFEMTSDDFLFEIMSLDDTNVGGIIKLTPKTYIGAIILAASDLHTLDYTLTSTLHEYLSARNAFDLDDQELRQMIIQEFDQIHRATS